MAPVVRNVVKNDESLAPDITSFKYLTEGQKCFGICCTQGVLISATERCAVENF